jgi:TPP-dependent indolepyruvate ferredoxin oxidoreductase alpha subunit
MNTTHERDHEDAKVEVCVEICVGAYRPHRFVGAMAAAHAATEAKQLFEQQQCWSCNSCVARRPSLRVA